jgi:hypothetical protein
VQSRRSYSRLRHRARLDPSRSSHDCCHQKPHNGQGPTMREFTVCFVSGRMRTLASPDNHARPSPRSQPSQARGLYPCGLLRTELDGARTWCRSLTQRLRAGISADNLNAAHTVSLRPTRPEEPGRRCSERQCCGICERFLWNPRPAVFEIGLKNTWRLATPNRTTPCQVWDVLFRRRSSGLKPPQGRGASLDE